MIHYGNSGPEVITNIGNKVHSNKREVQEFKEQVRRVRYFHGSRFTLTSDGNLAKEGEVI